MFADVVHEDTDCFEDDKHSKDPTACASVLRACTYACFPIFHVSQCVEAEILPQPPTN